MLRAISTAIKDLRGARHLPRDPRHSDVYLVEFPKSGVTWLSVLIGNAALIESGRSEIATFATSNLYVPDIHLSRHVGDLPYHRPPCRVIKSHAAFTPDYLFVVYLARHPLAVMKSYFTYLRQYGPEQPGSFDTFVRSEKFGIPAWRRHVRSWLTGPSGHSRILVLRYEDLLEDGGAELSRIGDAFGWSLGEAAIAEAVERSRAEKMAANEAAFHRYNRRQDTQFVRRPFEGEVGSGTVTFIETCCADELTLLGYGPAS